MTFRQLAQRIRVPAGFVLIPLLLIASHPTIKSVLAGSIVSLVGLAVRAWASGYLRKNEELTTAGPYAHTRNPLYLGTLLLGTGVAISTASFWFVALFMTLYLLIYVPVMFAEAETLKRLFPEDYEPYSRRVPLFLPRLTPYRAHGPVLTPSTGGERRFNVSQYMRHREYRAAFGLMVIYLLIAAKFFIIGR